MELNPATERPKERHEAMTDGKLVLCDGSEVEGCNMSEKVIVNRQQLLEILSRVENALEEIQELKECIKT